MMDFNKRILLIGVMSLLGSTVSINSYAIQTQIDDTSINTGVQSLMITSFIISEVGEQCPFPNITICKASKLDRDGTVT